MKYDVDVQNRIFDFCYMNALRDATLQLAFSGKTKDIAESEDVKELVKEYARSLAGITKPIQDDNYIYNLIDLITNMAPQSHDKENRIVMFKYGNAQKLVNMTAKYLFIRNYSKMEYIELFKKCHCPMDSLIIKAMKKDIKIRSDLDKSIKAIYDGIYDKENTNTWREYLDLPWSLCSEERYRFFQTVINKIIENKYNNEISPLEYDYLMWNP